MEEKPKRWVRETYPWDELVNSGDSFLIPLDKRGTGRQIVYAANRKAGTKLFRYDSSSGEVIKL